MFNPTDLHFDLVANDIPFDVVSFDLEEGLSESYRLGAELSSADPALDFGRILDQPATLTIWQGGVPVRHVHGVVTRFEQGATGFRRTRYRMVVEPALARLRLGSDWRIFQQQTVPEILATVLKEQGVVHYAPIVTAEHLPREYCVQAGDTQAYFLERIAREEGFYHAFTHEADRHTLVYGDRLAVFGRLSGPPVQYNPTPGGDQPEPALRRFSYAESVRTARQVQRDYTFTHPRYTQEHTPQAPGLEHQSKDYERMDYPGRYKRDAAGKPFSLNRLRGHRRDAKVATVEGDDARVVPGLSFQLEGHPRAEWNRGWRAVRIHHRGVQHTSQEEESAGAGQGTHYSYTAELIPDDIEWRAEPLPKPRIDGPQIATVVGPANEEVLTDAWGRVKVQFPWDRRGQQDEHSSCWIRVSQNWAGATWGHMAIPRIGQEVVVSYLDGDPDQPLVIGRTYRETNLPPYELPKHQTLATIRTKEFGAWRASELRFDDTSQQISAALMNDHGASALHLGYLTHPRPDGGQPRGEGFELRTDRRGAMRAAEGLLVTTEAQPEANAGQLSRAQIVAELEAALELAKKLGDYAGQHQGVQHDAKPQQTLSEAVRDLGHGANDEQDGSGGGKPVIAMSAPGGIAAATPASIGLAAGRHLDGVAQEHVQLTAGARATMNAGSDIGLFAHGGELRAIANQGPVVVQAQHNTIRLEAQQRVEISSGQSDVQISADKHITMISDSSAYLKMQGGNIELGMPGDFIVKAAAHQFVGPASEKVDERHFSGCQYLMQAAAQAGTAIV
ncbi:MULTISPECIES: type VI secretion system Vgr family protein [Burkholderia]|jgi:type VI secretion system secreted protein VgrG|uniref:Type VI secretion system tip protein VgrG n=1 Tax=Burkholderia contaminans TaxID=488447 RepID=A0A1E3FNY7_9BURK|nr:MULTISPECIES: type VI secretion system Vgr family protein [Burkholderia]UTP26750.1 type VI secretion system tip protein VgrG [Burkholderia sp. FXe9]MBA9832293.1 type VI secretion system tip protein VgrG [Burkholderia contaminans]MBA9843281.1 type VI secretion system tip protein VgrG [Burkholderia contaminans]MBA9868034.1 type VI secretion system tip protein VgrG [Burkholderia contaminans]MBA9910722.1 type VI secretion system tip protein VgrG [Burkholderia contaminans]